MPMSAIRIVALALAVALVPSAVAQPVGEEGAVRRAKEAFTAGLTLYRQSRFADAAAKFELAQELSPRAGNLFNLGRCYEQLQATARALRAFREYLRLSPDSKERPEVLAAITRLEAELRRQGVQQVAVRAEPEGEARVEIDARDVGKAPVVVELPKGVHTFEVSAEGYAPARLEHLVDLERTVDLSFILLPRAPSGSATAPRTALEAGLPSTSAELGRRYRWAWVSSAATALALLSAVGLGVAQLLTQNELRAPVIPRSGAENQVLADRNDALASGANVAYVGSGVLGITSVLLFIFEGRER